MAAVRRHIKITPAMRAFPSSLNPLNLLNPGAQSAP